MVDSEVVVVVVLDRDCALVFFLHYDKRRVTIGGSGVKADCPEPRTHAQVI